MIQECVEREAVVIFAWFKLCGCCEDIKVFVTEYVRMMPMTAFARPRPFFYAPRSSFVCPSLWFEDFSPGCACVEIVTGPNTLRLAADFFSCRVSALRFMVFAECRRKS